MIYDGSDALSRLHEDATKFRLPLLQIHGTAEVMEVNLLAFDCSLADLFQV